MTAQVLGVATHGGSDAAAALPGWLRERRLLLVLDNCEHALQALLQQARAELGDQAFETACAAGRKDSLAQAVALAGKWLTEDADTAS